MFLVITNGRKTGVKSSLSSYTAFKLKIFPFTMKNGTKEAWTACGMKQMVGLDLVCCSWLAFLKFPQR